MINKPRYNLTKPDPKRDAPFMTAWFDGLESTETLQLMGYEESATDITLAGETKRLESFLELENQKKQLTWIIQADEKTIGIVWLNLEDTQDVQAPALHIMIGDAAYRGQGIGSAVTKDTIRYAYCNLPYATLYSRYLVSDQVIEKLTKKLGFEKDGDAYEDARGLKWQNMKLVL